MESVEEINVKYAEMEAEVERKLEKIKLEEEKLEKSIPINVEKESSPKDLDYAQALQRNAELLKSLEISKARLRSRSTFSPIEQILEDVIAKVQKYFEEDCQTDMDDSTVKGVKQEDNILTRDENYSAREVKILNETNQSIDNEINKN